MSGADSQTEPKKKSRSRRFYLVLITAVILIGVIIDGVILYVFSSGQRSYGLGPIGIEVTPSKPFYLQGEEVNFTIYVNNPHDWPVGYPGSIRYTIEKDGLYVASLGGGQVDYAAPAYPAFPPSSKTLFRAFLRSWDQKMDLNGTRVQVEAGNYIFIVSLSGPNYDNAGNCTFEIR